MLTYPLRSRASTKQDPVSIESQEAAARAPVPDASAPQTPAPEVTSQPAPKLAECPGLIVVDDKSVNLCLLITFSTKRNYPSLTAINGQLADDAFENAHRNPTAETGIPNIILMDINTPVMNGYEAVQRIRRGEKQNRMPASKIITVTALKSEAAHTEAFGSGFDLFLRKPIKLRDLHAMVERG